MNALPGETFFHVATDAYGNACVKFRAKRYLYGVVEIAAAILATTDLTDWTHLVPMRYDAFTDTWHPAESFTNPNYVYPPAMFFSGSWTSPARKSDGRASVLTRRTLSPMLPMRECCQQPIPIPNCGAAKWYLAMTERVLNGYPSSAIAVFKSFVKSKG